MASSDGGSQSGLSPSGREGFIKQNQGSFNKGASDGVADDVGGTAKVTNRERNWFVSRFPVFHSLSPSFACHSVDSSRNWQGKHGLKDGSGGE